MTSFDPKKCFPAKGIVAFCIIAGLFLYASNALAQENIPAKPAITPDSVKTGQVSKVGSTKIFNADSIKKKAFNSPKPALKINSGTINAQPVKNPLKTAGTKAAGIADPLTQKLKTLKKQSVSFDLTVESDNRYQPLPVINSINPAFAVFNGNKKFVSAINVIGGINAWGIPLNFNYTTNRNLAYTPSALTSSLFKFDFDPRKFDSMLSSDYANYYELRKRAFAGLDLSGYTSKSVVDKLKAENLQQAKPTGISKYLSARHNIDGLLTLSETALKDSLYKIALADSTLKANIALSSSIDKYNTGRGLNYYDLQSVTADQKLTSFLTDTANRGSLRAMNREQLVHKFAEQSSFPDRVAGNGDLFGRVAQAITNEKGLNDSVSVIAKLNAEKAVAERRQRLLSEADTAYSTISGIKENLSKNGYDVKKILQMQQVLNHSDGNVGNSEMGQNYLSKVPANGLQSFFERVDAFKLGAYGNNVPGNVQSRDLFLTGTHLTFKSGGIPITFGYGNMNDVGSVKDNAFNSSVYNTPKAFTYISAVLNRSSANSVRVSVIGSYNQRSQGVNQYQLPAVSDNNVVFTLSKAFTFNHIGRFNVDVSKSTNVSSANYLNGTDAVLEKKGGMNYDLAADMFQAMSFGVGHRLDIKELGFSDNIYFNYAGLGYQNPANAGLGGGRMSLGGNLKKSLYKNKLQLTLRTDLKNRSISYTSNDKWHSLQFQADSRYIINRKFNVDLKYINNNTNKIVNGIGSPVYSLQKVEFDGNANYKIGKRYAVNHFGISFQDYTNAYLTAAAGASRGSILSTNFTQSVVFKRSSLNVSLFYNRELSTQKLIGDMFNSDLSYQYVMFGKLNMSSGVTYLDNSTIARQIGVKQGIQLFTKNNFDADAYVDVRKNLITAQYADLYASCRAKLMLRYHIK
ncbi:hypothetical protein [Mucilaginibacter celer]|uniref:Uncharacterized protein n=1 Tax=Mucilaginibacter celer TaxID=2305508 RepID=A0A494VGV6_9SPHI|nr:hypothetical protein [Mucilaginibacter celer]AYL93827.1 hypothetical protein HYN43_000290 [Mucilaginibacter celer]